MFARRLFHLSRGVRSSPFRCLASESLESLESLLRSSFKGLNEKIDKIDHTLAEKVDASARTLAEVKQKVDASDRTIGKLHESNLRHSVEKIKGRRYSEHLCLTLLEALGQVVLEGQGDLVTATQVVQAAGQLADKLLNDDVPNVYLRGIFTAIRGASGDYDNGLREVKDLVGSSRLFEGDNINMTKLSPDMLTELGKVIGLLSANHRALALQLAAIRDLLSRTPEEQRMFLLGVTPAGSPGLMLAQYIAEPSLYLNAAPKSYDELPLASGIVECDVRGEVKIYGSKALVQMGEIKRNSAGVKYAKEQLTRRLYLMEWAIKTLKPAVQEVMKVGEVFVPAETVTVEPKMVDDSMCISVHFV